MRDKKKKLKLYQPCLLRMGIEDNSKQSFIGAIASLFSNISKKLLTIKEMKEQLINSLNLDLYMKLQNGSLINIFNSDNEIDKLKEKIDINIYSETKIFKSLKLDDDASIKFMYKLVDSYNNFKKYLKDDLSFVDYKYIWDLICIPNKDLFPDGLNLVILEIKANDITNNVNIICPSNIYSDHIFDINKKVGLLLKVGNYYEPIYVFIDKGNEMSVSRLFNFKNPDLLPNIREVLELVKRSMLQKCLPFQSIKTYEGIENKSLNKLVEILNKNKIEIFNQIINYNGKVIGLIVKNEGIKGMISCNPSGIDANLPKKYKWIDDYVEFGNTYKDTKQLLNSIYTKTKKQIPSLPQFKIVEDGLIVGIKTITHQMIPLSEPAENLEDDLITLNTTDNELIDKKILTSDKKDSERNKYIKK